MKNYVVLDQASNTIFCAARTKGNITNFDCSCSLSQHFHLGDSALVILTKYYENGQIRKDEMASAYSTYWREKYVYSFVGKTEGKRTIGRPWGRWEDN